jgi:uncharacterized membrane protein YjgN (DUF898 family)
VRTRRYFYRNVILDGHGFDYYARPLTILKGRLIALMVIGGAYAVYWYNHIAGAVLFGALFFLSPWVVNQASRFNARMTSYRNVRFGFAGSYGRAFLALCVWPILGVLTLGVLWPFASRQRNAYLMENYRYGATPFSGKPALEAFYDIYLAGFGLAVFAVVTAVLMVAIAAGIAHLSALSHPPAPGQVSPLPVVKMMGAIGLGYICFIIVALFVAGFIRAKIQNVIFASLRLNDHRFRSELSGWRYGWVILSNLVVSVATLGLMFPWSQIRLVRYVANRMTMMAASDLSGFASTAATEGSVAASELAFLEGLAVGIGT